MMPEAAMSGARSKVFAPAGAQAVPDLPEAEVAVLAAIMESPDAYDRIGRLVNHETFSDPGLGAAFKAMASAINAGTVAAPATLRHTFETDRDIAAVGGAGLLGRLSGMKGYGEVAESYAATVLDGHLRRRTTIAAERALDRVNSPEKIDTINRDLISAVEGGAVSASDAARNLGDVMDDVTARIDQVARGQVVCIPTGYDDVDEMLSGGLEPGQLMILGARPGMGKTALALGIAERLAGANRPVLYQSLEMRDQELGARLLAYRMNIMPNLLKRRSFLTPDTLGRIVTESGRLKELPLAIDQKPGASILEVRMQARAVRKKYGGLGAIVIDHLGLMSAPKDVERHGLYQKVTAITGGLKALAQSMDCPVIALCQLSRAVEQREDKRPTLADLRDSGSIEQDADIVAFLYRQSYYDERASRDAGPMYGGDAETMADRKAQAELIFAKQRDGRTGTVDLRFSPARGFCTTTEYAAQ